MDADHARKGAFLEGNARVLRALLTQMRDLGHDPFIHGPFTGDGDRLRVTIYCRRWGCAAESSLTEGFAGTVHAQEATSPCRPPEQASDAAPDAG